MYTISSYARYGILSAGDQMALSYRPTFDLSRIVGPSRKNRHEITEKEIALAGYVRLYSIGLQLLPEDDGQVEPAIPGGRRAGNDLPSN